MNNQKEDELVKKIGRIRRNAEKINQHTWKVYKEQILEHVEQIEAGYAASTPSEQGSDGWIRVEDELPKISTARDLFKVQIYCEPLGVSDGYYWGTNDDPCKGWSIAGVSHWQPLAAIPITPTPPQSKE